ncbi:hypothetical protein GGS23DRAFT_603125 [Durotheca rogersii]|uniref:uncharacterized protein n=1 Tax=Durotheca rogersii TaxID=419775 RepID=UPI00221F115F|nr:uncharacterized protein GGS23DRAFT_603125 [Durotheca rogersii]KAI5866944.1 hypothetical protein GGS23DRAFT_603125 [Durotheca rogersii]
MPPALPVPSKIAINALRGIAFGTSCAIGVILEDQIRRISTLRTAIGNNEKLKSAKRYHRATESAWLPGEATAENRGAIQWREAEDKPKAHSGHHESRLPPSQDSAGHAAPHEWPIAPSELGNGLETSRPPAVVTQKTQPPPLPALDSLQSPFKFGGADFSFPAAQSDGGWYSDRLSTPVQHKADLDELAKEISGILSSKSEESLDRAIAKFFEECHTYNPAQGNKEEWVAISARLSRECQRSGRWVDANKILIATASAGPLEESQFYAHEPIPIIQFHLRQTDEAGQCSPQAIGAASRLFLLPFKDRPRLLTWEVYTVGRELFIQNLLLKDVRTVQNIYWRVFGLISRDTAEFSGWAIRELYRFNDYKDVIKFFLLNFSKTSPREPAYTETVDCVVYSVEKMKGLKANLVLRAFGSMNCPDNGFLWTWWIRRLLQAHYRRYQDFSTSEALFEEVSSLGLLSRINYPENVYRTMVDIAIEAGDKDKAKFYYETLIQKYPHMVTDVRLRGFLALIKAKAEDWRGVFSAFVEMQTLRAGQEKEYDQAFVMILKIFASSHPAAKVRAFVARYIDDLEVRMHRYVVTIVANKYGDCHDVPGFISWLKYCSDTGFTFDPSFCNAVLRNCRTKWRFTFEELQALYLQMQQMDPKTTDDVTQRIMSQAALTAGKCLSTSKTSRWHYPRSIMVNKLAYTGRTTNERDVYEAMNQELHRKRPLSALSIYKRALRFGMPPCAHCLRLAVAAALQTSNTGSSSAMGLILVAHERGDDVTAAVSTYIRYHLDYFQARTDDMFLHMQNLITRFEELNITIDPTVITHMAAICIKLDSHERAIALCKLAKDKGGHENLCFSRQSIRVLLTAYAYTLDTGGMSELIRDLLMTEYSVDRTVLVYLKAARRTVQKLRGRLGRTLQKTLEDGVKIVTARRAENETNGRVISCEVLQIMHNALEDVGGNGMTTTLEN